MTNNAVAKPKPTFKPSDEQQQDHAKKKRCSANICLIAPFQVVLKLKHPKKNVHNLKTTIE